MRGGKEGLQKVEHNPCWAHTAKIKNEGKGSRKGRREGKRRRRGGNLEKVCVCVSHIHVYEMMPACV